MRTDRFEGSGWFPFCLGSDMEVGPGTFYPIGGSLRDAMSYIWKLRAINYDIQLSWGGFTGTIYLDEPATMPNERWIGYQDSLRLPRNTGVNIDNGAAGSLSLNVEVCTTVFSQGTVTEGGMPLFPPWIKADPDPTIYGAVWAESEGSTLYYPSLYMRFTSFRESFGTTDGTIIANNAEPPFDQNIGNADFFGETLPLFGFDEGSPLFVSAEFTPALYWTHADRDGSNPIYDETTGAEFLDPYAYPPTPAP